MTTPVYTSGQGGNVTMLGQTYIVRRYLLRQDFKNVDTTGSGSEGWRNLTPILRSWSVVVDMALDTSAIPADDTNIPSDGSGVNASPTSAAVSLAVGASGSTYAGSGLPGQITVVEDVLNDVMATMVIIEGDGPIALTSGD